jgi:hypothetical protein
MTGIAPPQSPPQRPPFDARNYVPPGVQQPSNMYSTYGSRTSESAFNTAMQLHGGGVISPVDSGSALYPQSPAGAMSRSISAHPTEREAARLYDRPGTRRPRFQMPRSGVSSLLPNLSRGKSFPPGTFFHLPPTQYLFVHLFFLIYRDNNRYLFWCSDSRHKIADFGRPCSFLRTPGTPGPLGPP